MSGKTKTLVNTLEDYTDRIFTALAEARAQGAAEERERLMELALGSEADNYASYDGYVAEWLRSNAGGV